MTRQSVVIGLLVVCLLAGAAVGFFAGERVQSNSNSSNLQLSVLSAYARTPSGQTDCSILNQNLPPEVLCGVYINAGDAGTITLVVSNPSSMATEVGWSTASTEGPYVYFTSTPSCGTAGFCTINPNSSQSFQFGFSASISHSSSIQASLTISIARVSS
ncbi:MAG TPA: hypothetical protein VGR53_06960 [Nitrososphaerales archaeon]|nr:hypothetical protein [Nitrososphaerales archaeon]